MSDPSNVNDPWFVVDRINDAIVPDTNSPAIPITAQLLTPNWTWIRGELADSRNYARDYVGRQIAELFLG